MTATQFQQYLSQPLLIAHLAVGELERLVREYPYCAPLRLLLLKKYQLENPTTFEQQLPIEATYSPDRVRMYQFLHASPQADPTRIALLQKATFVSENPPRISAAELGLEKKTLILNDLSLTFDCVADATNSDAVSDVVQQIMPRKNKKSKTPKDKSGDENKKRFHLPRIPTLEDNNVFDMFPAAQSETNNDSNPENPEYILEEDPTLQIANVDDAFQFLLQTEDFLRGIAARVQAANNNSNPDDAELDTIANASVSDNEQIASETLAQLLIAQGQQAKAVKMYQRLRIQQPDKAEYFDQLIAQVKQKK